MSIVYKHYFLLPIIYVCMVSNSVTRIRDGMIRYSIILYTMVVIQ